MRPMSYDTINSKLNTQDVGANERKSQRFFCEFSFSQVHIQKVLELSSVRKRWMEAHDGKPPTEDDIESMYKKFVPLQRQVLKNHGDMIEGCLFTCIVFTFSLLPINRNS